MAEPNRKPGGNVAQVQEIDELTAIGPRRAGTDAERRAARWIQQRLESAGRPAATEPFRMHPGHAAAHVIHATLGIVASVLAVYVPAAGLALAFLATVSAIGDLTATFYLARLLLPTRASQNVVSDLDTGKPGVLALVAHYDAPRDGMLNDRRLRAWPRVFLGSLIVITLCSVLRVLGLNATGFTIVQFIPTVILIALIPAFADGVLAATDRGEHENGSGVLAALRIAQSPPELRYFDLMLVFTGASADSGHGMRAWLKRHGKTMAGANGAVVCLDDIARGAPAVATKTGPVLMAKLHPTLTEIAAESAGKTQARGMSDGYLARGAGLPTLVLTSEGAGDDSDALGRFVDYLGNVLEQIDAEIGPDLS